MDLSNEFIVHTKIDDVEVLKFKELMKYANIEHAFALKPLSFRNNEAMADNYKKLFKAMDWDYTCLVKPTQRHTGNVLIIDRKQNTDDADYNLDYLDNVDAVITNKPGIALATTCADCLNILLYDDTKKVIANIHSGWRGSLQKIAQKTANNMIEVFGCNPADIKAYMMPAIRKCHFEVGEDVIDDFRQNVGYMENVIENGRVVDGKPKYNIDNILINKNLLLECGIKEIYDSNICSFCSNEMIHSKRADGDDFGLCTTIIMMK